MHLTVRYGFFETPGPAGGGGEGRAEGSYRPKWTSTGRGLFFLSRGAMRRTDRAGMSRWRKQLFIVLAHNAANPAEFFGLPADQTVIMGSQVDV